MRYVTSISLAGLMPLLVLAAGCASGSGEYVGSQLAASGSETHNRVDAALPSNLAFPDATVDDLWRVLPAAFVALEIPAGVVDARNLVYGNQRVTEQKVADEYLRNLFRCASGSSLSGTRYRFEFGITAQPITSPGGGTELRIQTAALGRAIRGSSSGTTQCVSNGKLEEKIRGQVLLELAKIGE